MSQAVKRKPKEASKIKAGKKTVKSLTDALAENQCFLEDEKEENLRKQPNFDFFTPSPASKKKAIFAFDYYKYKLIDTLLVPIWIRTGQEENKGKKLMKNLIIDMYFNTYEILYFAYILNEAYPYLKEYHDKEVWFAAVAYKVKMLLNEIKDDTQIFKNCDESNLYVKARNLLKEEELHFGGVFLYKQPAFNELNKKYWEYFNALYKVIGEEDINKVLEQIKDTKDSDKMPKPSKNEDVKAEIKMFPKDLDSQLVYPPPPLSADSPQWFFQHTNSPSGPLLDFPYLPSNPLSSFTSNPFVLQNYTLSEPRRYARFNDQDPPFQ